MEKERPDKTTETGCAEAIRPAETPNRQEQLRYIPCSGHNRIWLMPVEGCGVSNSRNQRRVV